MNGMGDVLAAHQITVVTYPSIASCTCRAWQETGGTRSTLDQMRVEHCAHVEAALVAAGFGDTGQAARDALLGAADEMGRASRDERSASHWRAHAWANWLRARAAAVPVTSE